ncbi:MAG: PilW family protein [Verrucomicrobiota bacterium]
MRTTERMPGRTSGMSLVEMIVSMSIFGLVVAGSVASAILFAKIASEHENQSDFSNDLRFGLEQLALDARNASGVADRRAEGFTFRYNDSGNVTYLFEKDYGIIVREENGTDRVLFSNVEDFDILVDAADAAANPDLEFAPNRISIERLDFGAGDGTASGSSRLLTNLSFTIRNG